MSTNVSSVVSHFPDAENGFTTTTSGSVSSGATTVGLNSVAGYTNGMPVVMVIDPSNSKKQTFTGIMDTSGSQVTSVVWTAGTNVAHDSGATVVDYATATHMAMVSKGILVEHSQSGVHAKETITSRTEDTSPVTGDFILTYDASATALKKAQLGNITPYKADKSVLTTDSNPYKFRVRRNAALNSSAGAFAKITFDTEDYDTNSNFDSTTNNRYTAPVAGFYQFNARASVNGNTNTVIALYKNGSIYQRGSHIAGVNAVVGVVYCDLVQAAANDYFEIFVFTDSASAYEVSAGSQPYFSGYLVSRT